jgi:hypothetical protein
VLACNTSQQARVCVPNVPCLTHQPAAFDQCGATCPPGFACNADKQLCECAPKSIARECKCPGTFKDEKTGKSVDCVPGQGGFCYAKSDPKKRCTAVYMPTMPAAAGPTVCEPGLVFQNGKYVARCCLVFGWEGSQRCIWRLGP